MNPRNWPAEAVHFRDLAELVPFARNARTHTPEQINQIAASMREWGWTCPILVDEQNTVIAGHARIEVARKLGSPLVDETIRSSMGIIQSAHQRLGCR